MRKRVRLIALLMVFVLSFNLVESAAGASDAAPLLTYDAGGGLEYSATVGTQTVGDKVYLFLPSSADLTALTLSFAGKSGVLTANGKRLAIESGKPFDLLSLFPAAPANGEYVVTFSVGNVSTVVTMMCSGNLRALYITSSDAAKDQDYVEKKKGNKAKDNELVLLRSDGSCVYEGVIKEIKGRGNSTWSYPKKPYQIKLKEKVDLLETGDENEAEKTWVLLANYADDAMIRNSLTNGLAAAMGLKYAHHCEFVDLYYDGEYCGTYLLSEKTEIGEGRIDIRDLEGEIEEVNGEDVDFDDLQTMVGTNKYGNPMQYVDGVKLPDDYSGGYLLEIDYENRAKSEKSWFSTTNGQYVVSKSPEYLPEEALEFISNFYQEFEDAVFNGGIHPTTGKRYTDYVDLESLAKSYLLLTLAQNGDAFLSSTFFYIPEGELKLYAGPVWDFDTAYGLYLNSDVSGFMPARAELAQRLLCIDSFRDAVNSCWENFLQSAVRDTVLNPSEHASEGSLKSINGYAAECAQSQKMDAARWGHTGSYAERVEDLREFMADSYDWVETELTNPDRKWAADGFVDVELSAWFAEAVSFVSDRGYFSGVSDVMFLPGGQMTRGMVVTVLYRMAGSPEVTGKCSYTDTVDNTWYSNAVVWAEQNGITKGYGNGRFGVEDCVSREQLVVFLYRFAQLTGEEVAAAAIPEEFSDITAVSSWAKDAFGWAISEGIINGVKGNSGSMLVPRQTSTRAETAVMIQRYYSSF